MSAPPSVEGGGAAEAIAKYLDALRVSDAEVRERVTNRVLERVTECTKPVAVSGAFAGTATDAGDSAVPSMPLAILAMQELDRLMIEWFAEVLAKPPPAEDAGRFSARGRMALLLVDMPGRWQGQFLGSAPWPPEFVRAMRESFLHTRPDDHLSDMQPEPIDLGPIATLTRLSHLPYYRILLVWIAFALLLVVVFRLTH